MKTNKYKSRLDLVRDGINRGVGGKRQGRYIISLDRIREDPRNERKTFRAMDGLVASIQASGIIEPLTVTLEADGVYKIITGHRRFRAAREAGLDEIEVLIRDPEHEAVRRRKSVISNVQREDIGPVEMAEALQALLDEDDSILSQRQLAEAIGKDKRWISDMLGILRIPPVLQEKVRTSGLSISYDSMTKIARVSNQTLQATLVEDVLNGATVNDIRQKIKAAKEGTSRTGSLKKPKYVFYTGQGAFVIAQSKNSDLSNRQILLALKEAVSQADAIDADA